ncbi:histidine phosphatase family protein [Pseudomonadota bacterium]
MIPLLFIRHGRTEWNIDGRMQGQTDVNLSAVGRDEVSSRSIPEEYKNYSWIVSPLRRARETADLLGITNAQSDPRLMEMNWGEWEGSTRTALRRQHGRSMAENEARGIDFRPTGGESVREVCTRLQDWLSEVATRGRPIGAVTHKGVITVALALATDWDFVSKKPERLDWTRAHLFSLKENGELEIQRLNIDLG